jgi:hypothetical protein
MTERERSTSKEPLIYTRSLRTNVNRPARYGSPVSWASLKRKKSDCNLNNEQDDPDGEVLLASFMARPVTLPNSATRNVIQPPKPPVNAESPEDAETFIPSRANENPTTRKQRSDKGTINQPKKKLRLEPGPATTEFLSVNQPPRTVAIKLQLQKRGMIGNAPLRRIVPFSTFQNATNFDTPSTIRQKGASSRPPEQEMTGRTPGIPQHQDFISQRESHRGANITLRFHPHASSAPPETTSISPLWHVRLCRQTFRASFGWSRFQCVDVLPRQGACIENQ